MRLARKLMIATVATLLAVFSARAVVQIRHEIRTAQADASEHLRIIGRALRATVVEVWRSDGQERALTLVAVANQNIERRFVRWVSWDEAATADQRPRAPVQALGALSLRQEMEWTDEQADEPRLYYYVPLTTDGSLPGALEIAEPLGALRDQLRARLLEVLFTTGLLSMSSIVVLAVLGAVLLGRPMRQLAERARRIGAGDLTGPVHLPQNDEIGELAREMNVMCERLAEAQRRLEAESSAHVKAVDQLRHADRLSTVGKLASGIAHELGTPLNVVAGRAKMIATGEVVGSAAADSARTIADQAARMTDIIRQLLDFARRRGPHKAPCDLAELCRTTLTMLTPLAQKKRVELAPTAPMASVVVPADAAQIQQAFTNLVVNGIQAMPDGGALTVAVGTSYETPPAGHDAGPGCYAFIHVSDEGTGIAPELVSRVFEPFFTTKAVGEGTGLGLSVAYGIVRDHGGWIAIDTARRKGSRLSLYLPADDGTREGEPEVKRA